MSTHANPRDIARAFEESGCGWLLKTPDINALLDQVAQEIDVFFVAHAKRYGVENRPDPFSLLDTNPTKAAAFFQTLAGAPITTDMRVMVWELIMGAQIQSLEFHYSDASKTSIRIVLGPHRSCSNAEYSSKSLWDFQIFRHMGLLSIDGKPILDGYYATLE